MRSALGTPGMARSYTCTFTQGPDCQQVCTCFDSGQVSLTCDQQDNLPDSVGDALQEHHYQRQTHNERAPSTTRLPVLPCSWQLSSRTASQPGLTSMACLASPCCSSSAAYSRNSGLALSSGASRRAVSNRSRARSSLLPPYLQGAQQCATGRQSGRCNSERRCPLQHWEVHTSHAKSDGVLPIHTDIDNMYMPVATHVTQARTWVTDITHAHGASMARES